MSLPSSNFIFLDDKFKKLLDDDYLKDKRGSELRTEEYKKRLPPYDFLKNTMSADEEAETQIRDLEPNADAASSDDIVEHVDSILENIKSLENEVKRLKHKINKKKRTSFVKIIDDDVDKLKESADSTLQRTCSTCAHYKEKPVATTSNTNPENILKELIGLQRRKPRVY